jgi:hydrogenase maturation factor
VCLGEIGRITTVDVTTSTATVAVGDVLRHVSTLLVPSAATGDHVLLHSGHALEILPPARAAEALRLRPTDAPPPRSDDVP